MNHKDQMTCNNKTRCFFCTMEEPDQPTRRSQIAKCFKELPLRDNKEQIIILNGVWKIALAKPDDPEFPSLGIFQCISNLIKGCINGRKSKNTSITYYAAHITGSYTMNKSEFAEMAVNSGVLIPLMELLGGKMTWIEQRVAVRAIGHIASHRNTFKAVAAHELEIVNLAMKMASNCIQTVYNEFVNMGTESRTAYHCELMMTNGVGGGMEFQNKKAESWAIQIQSWSLYLLNCFAKRKTSINLICNKEFLHELIKMWGGLQNQNSFSGIGLIRTLCLTKNGREAIANSSHFVESLCNLSRSSDDCQRVAIESVMFLLKDVDTRHKVVHVVAPFLVDLLELRGSLKDSKLGDRITRLLLQDYTKIKLGKLVMGSNNDNNSLEEAWELKVERRKREETMTEEEFVQRKMTVSMMKKTGNQKFRAGEVAEAVMIYKKALEFCPMKFTKERIVLHSNISQCSLLQGEAESAISETTRALCLSGKVNPHMKSLWRRSQAFDMKGMSRESLMDCILFINERSRLKMEIPYYAIRLLNKQMNATWVFASSAMEGKTQQKPAVVEKAKKKKGKFFGW